MPQLPPWKLPSQGNPTSSHKHKHHGKRSTAKQSHRDTDIANRRLSYRYQQVFPDSARPVTSEPKAKPVFKPLKSRSLHIIRPVKTESAAASAPASSSAAECVATAAPVEQGSSALADPQARLRSKRSPTRSPCSSSSSSQSSSSLRAQLIKRVKKEEKSEIKTETVPVDKRAISEQWRDIECAELFGVTPGDV